MLAGVVSLLVLNNYSNKKTAERLHVCFLLFHCVLVILLEYRTIVCFVGKKVHCVTFILIFEQPKHGDEGMKPASIKA